MSCEGTVTTDYDREKYTMSKIMSVFEKLNLVEKTYQEYVSDSDKDYFYGKGEKESKNIEEDVDMDMDKDIEEIILGNSEKEALVQKYKEKMKEESKEEPKEEYKAPVLIDINQNNKYTIEEIYQQYGLENSDVNTIFMLGNFIHALPDSLPYEVRKKSLISIVASSKIDMGTLIGDGEKRLEALKQFSISYHELIANDIESHRKQIEELKKQIKSYEDQIKKNETLLKEQNNIIDFETDRIESIVDFLNKGSK